MLNFFTTGPGSYREEYPHLKRLAPEWHERGLIVVAISRGEEARVVEYFVRRHEPTFPVLIDEDRAASDQFADADGRLPVSTNILLGPDHRIVFRQSGYTERLFARLESEIEALLRQPPE